MMVIGLTGSIASGKSEVAKTFRAQNLPVFDADAAVHKIYEDGTAAKALANLCPEAIFGQHVDRKILSQLIAQNPALLTAITALIHPLVHQIEQDFVSRQENEIVVIDSPLILEAGRAREMDRIIVVSTSPENQKSRAMSRAGMTEEKLKLILSKQMPDAEKRLWADYIIENNGTLAELVKATLELLTQIKAEIATHA